jgi:hypothetical protein
MQEQDPLRSMTPTSQSITVDPKSGRQIVRLDSESGERES